MTSDAGVTARRAPRFPGAFSPFPSYEDWLRDVLSPKAADQWRYRNHESDEIPARIVGDAQVDPNETRRRKGCATSWPKSTAIVWPTTWPAGFRRRSSTVAIASTCTTPTIRPLFWSPSAQRGEVGSIPSNRPQGRQKPLCLSGGQLQLSRSPTRGCRPAYARIRPVGCPA